MCRHSGVVQWSVTSSNGSCPGSSASHAGARAVSRHRDQVHRYRLVTGNTHGFDGCTTSSRVQLRRRRTGRVERHISGDGRRLFRPPNEIQNPRPLVAGHEQCRVRRSIEQAKLANELGMTGSTIAERRLFNIEPDAARAQT